MNQATTIDVLTDGDCPLCRWMRARVEPFDVRKRLHWLNFREPEVLAMAAPLTFDELNNEMYAHLPDGKWVRGFDAWIAVLSVLPRLRWLSKLLSLWPLTRLGPLFYRWVAKRRFTLFGIPPPCSPDGVCSLHEHHRRS
jgi:predicted DCC family thiol-disulfide oxidoreductase YuxK